MPCHCSGRDGFRARPEHPLPLSVWERKGDGKEGRAFQRFSLTGSGDRRENTNKNALATIASAGGGERGIRTLEGVAPLAV